MRHLAERVLDLPTWLALLLVFALPALEASAFVGFVVPGEIGVLLGGVLSNQHRVALGAVLATGIAGAVVGDSIGYEVGRRYGERLLRRLPSRLVGDDRIRKGEDLVRRLGGRAVFVGRFTTALRVLVPGLAGMSRVRYPRFLAWNAAGGALWATVFVLLGYAAGSQWRKVEENASIVGFGLLGLLAVAGGVTLRRRRRRGRGGSGPDRVGSAGRTG